MALQTTGSAGLSDEMKTFYDRMLLERTVPNLLHATFGQAKRIPANGGRTIEWRKFSALSTATTPLVEGSLYTDLKDLTVTAITGTVAQYGDAVGFSDLVSTVAIDPILAETTKILAEQAAQTIDELIRDTLVAGTTVEYANAAANRAAIAANDDFASMDGAGGTQSGGSLSDLRLIALTLELNRARKINGYWQAITHPRVMFDIQSTTEWREAQLYNQTNRVFDGSVGEMYGIKFWVTDVAKVFTGAGASGINVYSMLVFGQDAFGIVELSTGNLQTIYKPLGSAGTSDPLNQQQTMGWKVTFGTKILQQAFMLRYECSVSTDNS
jgi:N4-gp56 family major capsid protein